MQLVVGESGDCLAVELGQVLVGEQAPDVRAVGVQHINSLGRRENEHPVAARSEAQTDHPRLALREAAGQLPLAGAVAVRQP